MTRTMYRLFLMTMVLVAGGLDAGHAGGISAPPWQDWQARSGANNPLAGRIWSPAGQRFIAPGELVDELSHSRYVLIGEVHDNLDHHRLQAWLIDQIAARREAVVVMEMIDRDQSSELSAYMSRADASAEGLGPAIGWSGSGWPPWPTYQPIGEVVIERALPLVPGNPGGAQTRLVAESGFSVLGQAELKRLGLDLALAAPLEVSLFADIRQSHCDLLPEEAIDGMAQVQRYRDAVLADALLGADKDKAAILIAGNGHVRTDRGVPWYLANRDPGVVISAVLLQEVGDEEAQAGELPDAFPSEKPVADFVWFTPRADREDQCELLRRQWRK